MKEINLAERKIILLQMMVEIDSFCRKNHILYYLAFGTLLGAVRHKGFIPWDDDIDIMMPREDYDRFAHSFPKSGLYQFIYSSNMKNYPLAFGKVIDTRTVKYERMRGKYQVMGLDIDVFPIDNYPSNLDEATKWCDEIAKKQSYSKQLFAPFSKSRNAIRTIAKNTRIFFRHIQDDLGLPSVDKLVTDIDALSQKYNGLETGYCGIAAINTYGVRKRNRKEVYDKVVNIEFEGKQFFAPIGYDEYLKDIYGDYMQLPPVEKRKSHHSFRAYWK